MPAASSANAMSMVFSRPMLSETQPKNGRVRPFRMRSIASANVRAGSVMPTKLTGISAILKSFAIGANDSERECEGWQRDAHQADWNFGDLEILRDRRELRRGHQPARA